MLLRRLEQQLVRRRAFLRAMSGAAAWPLAARAQQADLPVIGFLNAGSPQTTAFLLNAFRSGLAEIGFVEGKNLAIEYRWAEGRYDKLRALATELVRHQVKVIAALGTAAPGLAAKTVTSTIPIIFTSGDDPVKVGLVPNINHPGGNVTGVHLFLTGLSGKKLSLLHDLLPKTRLVGVCLNRSNQNAQIQATELLDSARALGVQISIVFAGNEHEIDAAIASLVEQRVGAIIVGSDPFYLARRDQFVARVASYGIPTVYPSRDYVAAGGLLSYGTSISDAYRQAGAYVGRVLKGEKPAGLPVVQSSKFEFAINLKTAKALGLGIPSGVLAIADEVIE